MDISGTVITTVTMTKISIATCSLGSSTKVMRSKFVNWLSSRNTGLFTVQLKT
jgi:hypothetical protein